MHYENTDMIKKQLIPIILLAFASCMLFQSSHAAGQIELVEGSVSVTTADGQLRIPTKGERIEAGDAIATGRNGEIHVHMDDDGFIALRPNTFLKVETYKADGGADDSVVFRLLRGSFRSITGWIGKSNPQKYAVHTPTATIGVRGTDHETLVVGEGEAAGTYDKVNSGETEMSTTIGKVSIFSGQAAYMKKTGFQAPQLLAAIPALFATTPNEKLIDSSKTLLEESRDERLKQKQKDNVRKGAGPDGKPKIGDIKDARKALASFEEILRAFEAGNVSLIRQKLDPSMIGYQQLLDNIRIENNECKQMRVTLLDTQVQAGPELAILQTSWEKRCLLLPAFTPKLTKGRSTILLHLGPGGWTFAAITGGSMLERSVGATKTVATLQVLNTGNGAGGNASYAAAAALPGQSNLGFTISVTDPDRAGATSVTVTARSSAPANDVQIITLPAISPGSSQFRVTSLNFSQAPGFTGCSATLPSNPTSLEICAAGSVTVTFTDNSTPSGSPQVLTKTVSVP